MRIVESLERRRLLSAAISGTTLRVFGTPADDTITVAKDQAGIEVTMNGVTSTFDPAKVKLIQPWRGCSRPWAAPINSPPFRTLPKR